ncbi:NACHT domain-containing protein [Lentzea sp. NBRC 102530]|uniref:NACHT domain-containing protein n=1 Tax=Lentzea sp. NBRC 102530 TaxID=3032201 RepID=UPI0024A04A2E|nr:NACHT domain-containing protein [Lentzea sp. NBRC 102530]GLY51666.1 hypothetical protein Lesp01_53220 [Lentzea sp. NBRC 102530]
MAPRTWVITAGFAVVAVILFVLTQVPLDDSDAYSSIAAALVAIGTAFTGIVVYLSREQRPRPAGEEADTLAAGLLEQWAPEVEHRRERFGSRTLIPLGWTGVGAGQTRVRSSGCLKSSLSAAAGGLADDFSKIPSRRLVVIGEPGAGKTFLGILLTVGLLRRRADGDPVPVFLSLSSWDPVADSLDDWLVRTLATTYYNGRSKAVRSLLINQLLVPVLDGLDELPDHARRRAMNRLNDVLGDERPLVLTCRITEYEDLIAGGAPVLLPVPVVRITPVSTANAVRHLQKWPSVANHVKTRPDSPVAAALSTPLMLSVFTAAYQTRSPDELLDTTRFGNRHAVEDHLVDLMVTALYPDEKHRRWLTHLAGLLHRHGDRDFRWWQLAERTLSPWIAPVVGVLAGAVAFVLAAVFLPASAMVGATPVAAVFTIVITTVWLTAGSRAPAAVAAVPGVRGFGRGTLTGAALVLVPGVPMVLLSIDGMGTSEVAANTSALLALSLITALGVGLHEVLAARTERVRGAGPEELLAQDRRSALSSAAVTGVLVGMLTVVTCTWAAAIGGHLATRFEARDRLVIEHLDLPALQTHVPWPVGEQDRPALVVYSVLVLLLFAAAVLVTRAWTRFLVARAALALAGRLPWRLMRFLAAARESGLLRVAGNGYQFWHVRLQERLVMTAGRTAPVRQAPRKAALVAAVAVTLTTVTAVTWAARPDDCPATPWSEVDDHMARVSLNHTSGCFAHVDRKDWRLLTGGDLLGKIALDQPADDDTRHDHLVVVGDLHGGGQRWEEVLEGIAAAQEVHEKPLVVDFVHTNTPYEATEDYRELVASLAGHTGGPTAKGAAILLDGTQSHVAGNWDVIGLRDHELPNIAEKYAGALLSVNHAQEPVMTKDELKDGISDEECRFLRKEKPASGVLDLDLRGIRPSYELLDPLGACSRARLLINEEHAYDMRSISPRLPSITAYYLEDRTTSAWTDCADHVTALTATATCALALLVADEGRVRIMPASEGA